MEWVTKWTAALKLVETKMTNKTDHTRVDQLGLS